MVKLGLTVGTVFLFLFSNINCGYSMNSLNIHIIYVLIKNKKNITFFIRNLSISTVSKIAVFLHRRVIVMGIRQHVYNTRNQCPHDYNMPIRLR